MMTDPRQRMMQSWRTNADAWTAAVRDRQIESRQLVTDSAILEAVLRVKPRSILDVGCGEGWLCRALAARGITTVGMDASPELIDRARALGGEFYVSSYDAMPDFKQPFGAIVCNFSLLEEDLDDVIHQLGLLLEPKGSLLIQTVHPEKIADDCNEDGWQVEHFTGFGSDFSQAMPWYFRRLESWVALLTQNQWVIKSIAEPVHPTTQEPLSLLLECQYN
jgi:2-polyprenyl-3-methyl-5-hydroxy-6-metoxy-1,4-benzoquinol methylase